MKIFPNAIPLNRVFEILTVTRRYISDWIATLIFAAWIIAIPIMTEVNGQEILVDFHSSISATLSSIVMIPICLAPIWAMLGIGVFVVGVLRKISDDKA